MAGAIAPAKAPRCLLSSRGPKPPASARPAPGGRWPAFLPDLPVCGAPSRTGGENAGRLSCSRPEQVEKSQPPAPPRQPPAAAAMTKAIALAPRRPCYPAVEGQSPWPASGPPPGSGAGLYRAGGNGPAGPQFLTGRGNAVRFLVRPDWQPFSVRI